MAQILIKNPGALPDPRRLGRNQDDYTDITRECNIGSSWRLIHFKASGWFFVN